MNILMKKCSLRINVDKILIFINAWRHKEKNRLKKYFFLQNPAYTFFMQKVRFYDVNLGFTLPICRMMMMMTYQIHLKCEWNKNEENIFSS